MVKNNELLDSYCIKINTGDNCRGRLLIMLKTLNAGRRLSDEDFVWLSSVAKDYFSEKLQIAYHKLKAEYFVAQYRKTNDSWMAVNASAHFRKCDRSHDADLLLGPINIEKQPSSKLKAAICTTHGGAKRDLQQWEEALHLGKKAHEINQNDYRPCTLLGAIYMETGHYTLGQEWYAKAIERGATTDSVDQDIRKIFFHADQTKQAEMRKFLLADDPIRYKWAKQKSNHSKQGL